MRCGAGVQAGGWAFELLFRPTSHLCDQPQSPPKAPQNPDRTLLPPAEVKSKKQNAVVWMLKTKVADFIDEKDRPSPFERQPTGIYRPRVITRRIAAQGGVFTAHRMMKEEGFVALDNNRRFRDRLVKFTVEASAFPHIRKHLDGCGVNCSTLFPDLVGLCNHLEWRYTKLSDE